MKKRVFVISKIPTPHNNVLVERLLKQSDIDVEFIYAKRSSEMYSFSDEVFINDGSIKYLENLKSRIQFLLKSLANLRHTFLFIGWPGNTVRLLILIFYVIDKEFCFWTDNPIEFSYNPNVYPVHIRFVRRLFYHIVKARARKIFVVGESTKASFIKQGFAGDKLVNLPIFIDIDTRRYKEESIRNRTRQLYRIGRDEFLITAGSRLTHEKGYDILMSSIKLIAEKRHRNVKLLLVGKGEEKERLVSYVSKNDLSQYIIFQEWLAAKEFYEAVASSDLYVHPARFDAFGGGTLIAMALGIPVVGSTAAGSVVERVINGYNGFIYEPEDYERLAELLIICLEERKLLEILGKNARKTAERWPPEVGVQILRDNLFG